MPKGSQGPWVGVSVESLVQDHSQLWVLVLGSLPLSGQGQEKGSFSNKNGKNQEYFLIEESTSIKEESGSYKSTWRKLYIDMKVSKKTSLEIKHFRSRLQQKVLASHHPGDNTFLQEEAKWPLFVKLRAQKSKQPSREEEKTTDLVLFEEF